MWVGLTSKKYNWRPLIDAFRLYQVQPTIDPQQQQQLHEDAITTMMGRIILVQPHTGEELMRGVWWLENECVVLAGLCLLRPHSVAALFWSHAKPCSGASLNKDGANSKSWHCAHYMIVSRLPHCHTSTSIRVQRSFLATARLRYWSMLSGCFGWHSQQRIANKDVCTVTCL
jgi:hypothetical protein